MAKHRPAERAADRATDRVAGGAAGRRERMARDRRRARRLAAELLEDRRLLAVGAAAADEGYGRVDPTWFASLPQPCGSL